MIEQTSTAIYTAKLRF